MLPVSVKALDVSMRNRRISTECHFPNKIAVPPKLKREVAFNRAMMTNHLETRFKTKFTDNRSSMDSTKTKYSLNQVRNLTVSVERMLFASASSLESYADTSTLDERIRYIVIRFLQKKLRTRAEDNHRKASLALSGLAAKEKENQHKESIAALSGIHKTFQRMSIQPTTITPTKRDYEKGKRCSQART